MASSQTLTLTLVLLLFSLPIALTSSSEVSLSVSPKTLTKRNNKIRIEWSNLSPASDLDFVAIYSPPSSPDSDFIGYLFLNGSGSGSISLPLVNLRSPYNFRIFHWTRSEINSTNLDNDGNPIPVTTRKAAESEEVRFESELGPDQVHLAYADGEDEMRVVFLMGGGGLVEEGWVRYGVEEGGGRWERVVRTAVRRYEREEMCDFPAKGKGWRDPGWVHDGVMKGLKKGKKYFYQVKFLDFLIIH